VVFVQMYSTLKFGKRLGPTANFQSYPTALATVYQMVTGDEWMVLMEDSNVKWPECTPIFSNQHPAEFTLGGYLVDANYKGPDYEFGDCGSPLAPLVFVVFMLFCQSVMLNLFIGMILDNFAFITEDDEDEDDDNLSKQPTVRQVHDISVIFSRYDFSHSGMLVLADLF
jgi:hypothetical protein